LAHSLHNVVEGNTLTKPQHLDGEDLQTFDFIVSNPPFNTDFSADVETLEGDKYDRFFAGIPNIPIKKKDSMSIYQVFLQHILTSLNDNGKAAVVVPTGFLTAKNNSIPVNIRKRLIDKNWLTGIITMPPNIFANTPTSVSILFIDKKKSSDEVFLMDATKIGNVVTLDEGKRTILSNEDTENIVQTFKRRDITDKFTVSVSIKTIIKEKYNLSAGQYFTESNVYIELSEDEYIDKISDYKNTLNELFKKNTILNKEILEQLEEIKYV
jgi:type I restriction enzyme M protein